MRRSTNGIYWHVPNAYNVFHNACEEQADKYLRPLIAGKTKDAYAVTEAEAGSGPVGDRDHRRAHRQRLSNQRREEGHLGRSPTSDRDGERHRWDERPPTLFLIDATPWASRSSTTRSSPTTTPRAIPLSASPTPRWRRRGGAGVGTGEERSAPVPRKPEHRSARSRSHVAAARGDGRVGDHQGPGRQPHLGPPGRQLPTADSAADAAAGRLLTYQVAAGGLGCRPEDRSPEGLDGEAVRDRGRWRCADSGVQAFGGAATCAPSPPSGCCERAWTGSGRAPARSSG